MLFPINQEGARNIQEVIWFDRYLVLSELGRGSGSIVYLVRHQKLGEYRAVKRILKDSDATWKIQEVSVLNRLKHPRIPRIYDMEEDDEAYYIIEEYIEGESLEALLLQSLFITPDFIYHTIMEVADVLDYMHHVLPNPVIYQDLKLEHVIIGKDGARLIDFGIASCQEEMGNKFQNYGTPNFCAPEKRSDAKISVQTDVYSIGKLLEELICAEGTQKSQYLMYIAKKATNPVLTERYESIRAFCTDFAKYIQSDKNSVYQKHLLKKIVIAGSQPRIGTTHLSISFTEFLNRKNLSAVYQEKNPSDNMRMSIRQGGFTEEGGLYRRRKFFGMPAYGEGVMVNSPRESIEILDYGTDLYGALSEQADLFLLVMGCKEWEIEYAKTAYETVKQTKNLVLIANYGNKQRAKQYAKQYERTVYCFPLDENPFQMTKEKEGLFERLLEKYWTCWKYPRQWGDALVCGIGKLCSKWIR